MPIPTPRPDEDQNKYIRRCYVAVKDEYKTAKALAICYQKYRDRLK